MSRSIYRGIEKYSQYYPTSLSLKDFIEFGGGQHNGSVKSASEKVSVKFLKREIPVRLANILKELDHLPKPLLVSSSMKQITSWYQKSFEDVYQFEKADHTDQSIQEKFTATLEKVADRHEGVVERMAEGVMEFRDAYKYDMATHQQIQYFLDRFYTSRISIRMLINQHTMLFGSNPPKNPNSIGCIDTCCDVLNIAKDAYATAQFLCERYYMTSPNVEYECINGYETEDKDITFVYVPSHLYHMLFEVFKNAMRAVVEHHNEETAKFEPIKCLICKGKEDIVIRISDRGGGIPRSQLQMLFNYMYSTAPRPMQSGSTSAPLAGYGYGLPLSRLYAQYLHGDITVSTIDGYGTDAVITLKILSSHANERLPIYNAASSTKYLHTNPIADWSIPNKSK